MRQYVLDILVNPKFLCKDFQILHLRPLFFKFYLSANQNTSLDFWAKKFYNICRKNQMQPHVFVCINSGSASFKMHSRWNFIAPDLCVSFYSASTESAVAASGAGVLEWSVFPLLRGADLPHPVCCCTSASGRIFRRRWLLSSQ